MIPFILRRIRWSPPMGLLLFLLLFSGYDAIAQTRYTIRIAVHIVRLNDGSGGQTDQAVYDALETLQEDFAPHNICFSLKSITPVNNTDHYYFSYYGDADLLKTNYGSTDVVDIYFLDNSILMRPEANGIPGNAIYVGGKYIKRDPNDLNIILESIDYIATSAISHEMGHCLGLYHTHHGTFPEDGDPDQCPELVIRGTGSNCTTCGDYVCDTPADPNMEFKADPTTCVWTNPNNSKVDANNTPYNPDELNIMGLSHPNCVSYFTAGQKDRMATIIDGSPLLQAVLVPEDLILPTGTNTSLPISSGTRLYAVGNSITAPGQPTHTVSVSSTAQVRFKAGKFIHLKNGFSATPATGGYFHAKIEDICGVLTENNSARIAEQPSEPGLAVNPLMLSVYPNPFESHSSISYTINEPGNISLFVSDIYGQIVARIITDSYESKGTHSIGFDATQLASGTYFITLRTVTSSVTIPVIIAK